MKLIKCAVLCVLGGLVSACDTAMTAGGKAPFEPQQMATMAANTPLPEATLLASVSAPSEQAAPVAALAGDVRVDRISVRVPRDLKVSEANRYLPRGDIVWRGDAIGDRYEQVQAIFETAMQRGTADMQGATPITLDIEVRRFHALTEKARYSVGGVHSITFNLVVRDARTGAVLGTPRQVRADLDGFGGEQALRAEAAGQTQKVRITDHLAEVIRQELTTAEGFTNPKLGFIQAMNGG